MKKAEQIEKLKKAIASGALPDNMLQEMKTKLAQLEKEEKPEAKAPSRKDIYAHLDAEYPNLTSADIPNAGAFKTKLAEVAAKVEAFGGKDAKVVAKIWLGRVQKKAAPAKEEKPKVTPPKAVEKPKPVSAPKPAKEEAPKAATLTWEKPNQARFTAAEEICLPENWRMQVVTERTEVILPLVAEVGDGIIFTEKGHPFSVVKKANISSRCKKPDSDGMSKEDVKKFKKEYDALLSKVGKLELEKSRLEAQISDGKVEKIAKPTPAKPKAAVKKTSTKPKKRGKCTLEDAEMGVRLNKVVGWFHKEAEDYRKSQTTRQITKIYRTKETGEIIIEVADYAGFVGGVKAHLGERKYYRLCVDSFNEKKVEKPDVGSYTLVVSDKEMKKIYTTKGAGVWAACLDTYRSLLKSRLEKGEVSEADRKRWQEAYTTCGDLRKKLELNPQGAKRFADAVRDRRKSGEPWNEAQKRVAAEIKAEFS